MSTDSPFTSQGLIRELSDMMFGTQDDNPIMLNSEWIETLACCLVGMMIGPGRYLRNQLGTIYGNIMVIVVGPSAIAFKTVPLVKYIRPILKELTERTNQKICESYGTRLDEVKQQWKELKREKNRGDKYYEKRDRLEKIFDSLVDFESPQRFTSEFLTTWLKQHPQGYICGDEYTKLVKGARKKSYLVDTLEDFSRLYDCDMEKVGTQKRGIEHPQNVYVCFSSASTYHLLSLMNNDFFIQGTGTRMLWILDKDRKPVDITDEVLKGKFWWTPVEDSSFRQQLINIIEKLMRIDRLPKGLVQVNLRAGAELDEYRLTKYNEAVTLHNENVINQDSNLVARLAQNAMKLALIHCIGRYAAVVEQSTIPRIMELNLFDAKWGIAKMDRHWQHYKDMMHISKLVKKSVTTSYTDDHDKVLDWIDELKDRGVNVTKTQIMTQTGWSKDDCGAILDAMLATGKIEMYDTGRIYGGKKVIYYRRIE